jgi:hypothetical protein
MMTQERANLRLEAYYAHKYVPLRAMRTHLRTVQLKDRDTGKHVAEDFFKSVEASFREDTFATLLLEIKLPNLDAIPD